MLILVNEAKRSLLLNLWRVKGDLATWKPGYFETLTEPSSAPLNLTFTSFKARVIALLMADSAARPKTVTGIRILQPHEVPPSLPGPHVQSEGYRVSDRHPRFAKLLLYQIEPIGQQAACTQEHRMLSHACGFLTVNMYADLAGPT
jgi:hypothetical protein